MYIASMMATTVYPWFHAPAVASFLKSFKYARALMGGQLSHLGHVILHARAQVGDQLSHHGHAIVWGCIRSGFSS